MGLGGGHSSRKGPRQDHAWCVGGIAKRPLWLEQSEQGESKGRAGAGHSGLFELRDQGRGDCPGPVWQKSGLDLVGARMKTDVTIGTKAASSACVLCSFSHTHGSCGES